MDEHSKEGTRGQFPLCPVLQEWTVSLATYAENFRQSAVVLATSHFNNITRFVCPTFTTVRHLFSSSLFRLFLPLSSYCCTDKKGSRLGGRYTRAAHHIGYTRHK